MSVATTGRRYNYESSIDNFFYKLKSPVSSRHRGFVPILKKTVFSIENSTFSLFLLSILFYLCYTILKTL